MKFEGVRLTALDFHDKTFLIGSSDDHTDILHSIEELGIINPPLLRRREDKHQIICGWKRIKVCKQLGYDEIPSAVYELDELSDEDCLKFVFYENQQRLNDVHKAELVFKFKFLCDLNDDELIQKVLPLVGIRATRRNLERCMSLAGLDIEIKEAYYKEKISTDQALSLSEVEPDQRVEILGRILQRFKYNSNETREMVRDLLAVASRDKMSVGRMIDRISSEIGRSGDKNQFRHALRRLRYPFLSKVEENYKTCLSGFNLPKDIGIYHSPFFEGNDLEIRLKFRTSDRLSELLSCLSSIVDDRGIEKLLNIVKEGKP
jgi:ParB/RepB/Spo0J family partition protein